MPKLIVKKGNKKSGTENAINILEGVISKLKGKSKKKKLRIRKRKG